MGTLNDRTSTYLGYLGFSGSLNDRLVAYWASEGFSGSFNDKCKAYLKTTGFKTLNKWMESLDGPIPVNTVAPAISGTPTEGVEISVTDGTWTNSPDEYEYQWRLDSSVEGTSQAFTPGIGSAGQWCSARVRARKTGCPWSVWVSATGDGAVAPA